MRRNAIHSNLKGVRVTARIAKMKTIVLKLLFDIFAYYGDSLKDLKKTVFLHVSKIVRSFGGTPFWISARCLGVEGGKMMVDYMLVLNRNSAHPS